MSAVFQFIGRDYKFELTSGNTGPRGPRGFSTPDTGGAGSPVVPSIEWRPGRPSQDFSYATYAEVRDLFAINPQMRVLLNTTDGPCVIEDELECDQRTIFESGIPGKNEVVYLDFAAGAKLKNPYRFNAVGVRKSLGGGPVIEMNKGGRLLFSDACSVFTTALVDEPLISIKSASVQILFQNGSNAFQQAPTPAHGLVKIEHASASTLVFAFQDGLGNAIPRTMVEGRPTDNVIVVADESWQWTPQSLWVGTPTILQTARSENIRVNNGPTEDRPLSPGLFEFYGDTDLGLLIVWTGAAWTNLMGTPV